MSEKIYYRCRKYKYQLAEDYVVRLPELLGSKAIDAEYFSLSDKPVLTVRKGYAWDGPSGPTADTKDFMRGSLVHDVLYQAIRMGLLPEECKTAADDILYRLCREDGMGMARAWWVLKGVRWFGGSSCEPGTEEGVVSAP